jgi:hypothetical protein
MPSWFKPLVNKGIKEGDDVTKKFATKEREIVHTKKIDDVDEVTVHQDLDTGNVRVEYGYHLTDDTGKVIRASNDPEVIHLSYKAAEEIPLKHKKGSIKTKEEFSAVESEPEIVNWDGDIEMTGINEVSKIDDLITDTSKLQKYATDKKLTIKELSDSMKKQKYKNKLETDTTEALDYIEKKHGPFPDPGDYSGGKDSTIEAFDKYYGKASGGRVPLWKGSMVESDLRQEKIKEDQWIRDALEFRQKMDIEQGIKAAPEGVLMDPPPTPNYGLIEELKNPKDRGLMPMENYVYYDDGTVLIKHEGKYYNQDGTQVDGPSPGAKPVPKTMEAAGGGRVPLAGGLLAKGIGKFTKAEVLEKMFENTIKQSKSANTKKRFTNFLKEVQKNPELANDPKVWGFFTKGLPKNQRLVVHSDDTVDFWKQSEFGPHNIETTNKFMQKHPHLSRDEAVRIQNMEPEDQILEMKRLETIADRSRTKNATGGRVSLSSGGVAGMLGE